jgi:hypothetical protein
MTWTRKIVLGDSFLDFECWQYSLFRFLARVWLSVRKSHHARRLLIDDEECIRFLAQVTAADHRYHPHLILNFDGLNWYLVMPGEQTVWETGAESVQQHVNRDPKANISFFATITTEGQNLPLILIAKGGTVLCSKHFSNHDHHQFDI